MKIPDAEFLKKATNQKKRVIFPKRPNAEVVVDFYNSKYVTQEPKKNWDWDVAKNAPDMQLVEERARLHERESKLAQKREYMKRKRIQLDEAWSDLKEKEENFRDMFIKFNRFVRENIEKRERASQKAYEQYMLRAQRHQDILALKDKMKDLTQIKKNMDVKIKNFRIYENFLDHALEGSEQEFKSVLEILNRYENLVATRQHLAKKQERDLTALETARSRMSKAIESFNLTILGLNNRINDLHLRFGNAHRSAIKWESVTTQIKQSTIEKLQEIISLRQNCRNLYKIMCDRKNIEPELDPQDIEGHFVFIKKTLTDMKVIDKRLKKDETSTRGIASKERRVS